MLKLIEAIEVADAAQIDLIFETALKRKRELYPDWEIMYYAYTREEVTRIEDIIRRALETGKAMERE